MTKSISKIICVIISIIECNSKVLSFIIFYLVKNHIKMNMIDDILYEKPLRVRFDKIDGFIIFYAETRYLILFGPEKK